MKQNYRKKSLKLLLALSLGLCVAHTGYAAPSGGEVQFGNGTINGNDITGLSGTSIINWMKFSIANSETVNFTGNGPWAVLNRVTGNDISDISGTLNGVGGTVFLVNPNGIVFGNGASINAASFVASTLSISDDSFTSLMNGGTGSFLAGTGDGKISFADAPNFNSTNSIFMGKSIEIDPGVNLTLNNSTAFLAGPNIDLLNTPNSGNSDITSMRITNASADNSININGKITSTAGVLSILGGKVDINGDVSSAGDMFIAAGNQYRFRKDANGKYGFSHGSSSTSDDNTITIAQGTNLTTTGNTSILANSVTNNGNLTVGKDLAIHAFTHQQGKFENPDGTGNLISTASSSLWGNNFINTGTIEAGKIEVLAASIDNSGTLRSTAGDIILDSVFHRTITSNGDQHNVDFAHDFNLIKSTGTIDSKGTLAMLGGSIDINGDVSSEGDMFIAAGETYSLVKEDGDFWFGFDNISTDDAIGWDNGGTGNTVNIANGANVISKNELGILANSVTNNGTITVNNADGLAMYIVDDMQTTFDPSGNPISANIVTSKNNKFTNNGTVTVNGGGRVDIIGNAIDNQGTITTTRGDVVLTGNLTGNAIDNTKLQVANDQYTGILMTPDSSGEPTYSFINPVQIPEVEKGSALESAINQAMDILNQKGVTPEVKAKATLDIIAGHATAGVESSKESTETTPMLTTANDSSATTNLSSADNNTASNLTVEDQEVQ